MCHCCISLQLSGLSNCYAINIGLDFILLEEEVFKFKLIKNTIWDVGY